MDKSALRAEMRARRRAFVQGLTPHDRVARLHGLAEQLLPALPADGIVAGYSATGFEIDPAGIFAALAHRLALPYFADADAPMEFRLASSTSEAGPFRIPQPMAQAPLVKPDIVLVPLVAADRKRNRLGQGKGHYDRALACLAGLKPVLAIGLAWDVQIIDRLPTDPWDVPLDLVVTPTRTLR